MKKTFKFLATALSAAILCSLSACSKTKDIDPDSPEKYTGHTWGKYDVDSVTTLDFRKNSDSFTILQLTDTHIRSVDQLEYMKDCVGELVTAADPDLIVITGDSIWKSNTKAVLSEYVKVMDSFKTPFALVFGNHDRDGDAKAADFERCYNASEYGIFFTGPKALHGESNYQINVKNNKQIVYTLMFLDSGDSYTVPDNPKRYDWIRDDQVDYYAWCIKGVSAAVYGTFDPDNNKVVPSMMFYHVPQQEFWDCRQQMLADYGMNVKAPDGSIATETDDDVAYDERLYPCNRSKLVEMALELKSTKAMFVGHLHRDRSVYAYNGLMLIQGLKTLTTYSYYGCEPGESPIEVGGTCIKIKADGSYDWTRIYSSEQFTSVQLGPLHGA
ncbi:MAG: metallophosphoesterase [Clostridiales bacterium]|nr:metallophosphoesterase [Clostridiales bacterium]